MSSEIKADKWSPASGTAGTIGDNGDTFTVPSGVTHDVASGATLDTTGATVTGITSGITEADQWRVTANFSGGADPIASNWERNDTNFDKIGTGMSESSGVFTFPSTGIWEVSFNGCFNSNVDERYIESLIQNNTGPATLATQYASIAIDETAATYAGSAVKVIVDCTDTSTLKIKFKISRENSSGVTDGHSDKNMTYATFIRLGDS